MDFSQALHELRIGKMLTRSAWTGVKCVYVIPAGTMVAETTPLTYMFPEGTEVPTEDRFALVTADSRILSWEPSTPDLFGMDWSVCPVV